MFPQNVSESSVPNSVNASFTTFKTSSTQVRDIPKQQITTNVIDCDEPIEARLADNESNPSVNGKTLHDRTISVLPELENPAINEPTTAHAQDGQTANNEIAICREYTHEPIEAGLSDNESNPLVNGKTLHDRTISVLPELESPAINEPTSAHSQDGQTANSEIAICREYNFRTKEGLDLNSINAAFIIAKLSSTPISDIPIQQTTLQTLDCGEPLKTGPIDDETNGKIPHDCTIPVAQELDCPATNVDLAHNEAERAEAKVLDEAAADVLLTDEMGSLVLEYSKAESSTPAIIFHDRHEAPREMGSMVTHAESIEYNYSKDSDKSGSGGLDTSSTNDTDDAGNISKNHDNLGRTLQTTHGNGTTIESSDEDEDEVNI